MGRLSGDKIAAIMNDVALRHIAKEIALRLRPGSDTRPDSNEFGETGETAKAPPEGVRPVREKR